MLASPQVEVPDDYAEFYEYACERGWTDGMPVVPPTEARVRRMLEGTLREPGAVIGNVPPAGAGATVEKIAINAVMAGCSADYLEVVIAAVDALCDAAFRLGSTQVTTNPVAPMLIVNGPIRRKLGVNCGGGCLGPGWRANATIGRAVSLILRNIGGALPQVTSRTTHGQPARYALCFGENEEESPWEPLHVERGFPPGASTVTVAGMSGTMDVNSGNTDVHDVLRLIANGLSAWGSSGMIYCNGVFVGSTVVLTPGRAHLLAEAGFTKKETKRGLWGYSGVPSEVLPYKTRNRAPHPYVVDGKAYPARDPDDLLLVVAGAHEPYHAVVAPGMTETRPVTRAIAGM